MIQDLKEFIGIGTQRYLKNEIIFYEAHENGNYTHINLMLKNDRSSHNPSFLKVDYSAEQALKDMDDILIHNPSSKKSFSEQTEKILI